MTKADKNFKELCTRILEEGYNTKGEKVRPKFGKNTICKKENFRF